jgi:hypothetical protein
VIITAIQFTFFGFLIASHASGNTVLATVYAEELEAVLTAGARGCVVECFAGLVASLIFRKSDCPEEANLVKFAFEQTGPKYSNPELLSRDTIPCAHSLFEQPWWLDAVALGAWDDVVVVKDGETVGRLPFMRKRRYGLTILSQPPLTQFLGPWIKAEPGEQHTRLAHEYETLTGLIDALPHHDIFVQSFHRSMTNCLAFHWSGFSHSVRYTYVLEELNDHDKIWAGFRENIRREIRKAERHVVIRSIDDIEILIALIRMTFQRQGIKMPYSADVIRSLDNACAARGVRRILLAEGADGAPHAGLYLVWDAESAYYLMGGLDPDRRTSGAMSLLMWETLKFAGQVTRRFDFEGSMLQPVERFFRAFGARQVQYPQLSRGGTLKGQLALLAQELHSARKRRPT